MSYDNIQKNNDKAIVIIVPINYLDVKIMTNEIGETGQISFLKDPSLNFDEPAQSGAIALKFTHWDVVVNDKNEQFLITKIIYKYFSEAELDYLKTKLVNDEWFELATYLNNNHLYVIKNLRLRLGYRKEDFIK